MEDEQGDVGPVSSGAVSESPLRGNFPIETPVENMGSENHVEESYEEVDGEEIMVNVVGSDVFVDGVSGHKEGDSGPELVEDLEGRNLATDISTDGDVSEMGKDVLGFSERRDEKDSVVIEEVNVSFSESATVDGDTVTASSSHGLAVLHEGVWNPGIEPTAEEATKATPVTVGEDKMVKDGTVDKNSADFVVDGKVVIAAKEEVLPSSDNAENGDHLGEDSVKSHGAGQKVRIAEKEEVLLSSDNAENDDYLGEDSVKSHGAGQKVGIAEKEEVLPSSDNGQNDSYLGEDSVQSHEAGQKVCIAEKEEVLPSSDNTENDDHLVEDSVKSHGVGQKVSIAQKEEVLPSGDNAENDGHLGKDSVKSHGAGQIAPSEVSLEPSCEGPENVHVDGNSSVVGEISLVNAKDGSLEANAEPDSTEKEVLAAEGEEKVLKSDAFISVAQDETQGSVKENHGIKFESNLEIHDKSLVSEKGEVKNVESDDIMDFKDGASNVDLPDSSFVGNDEFLKTDGDLETDMVHQNHVFSNEPTQPADGGDTAEVNKDKSQIESDKEEYQPNIMSSSEIIEDVSQVKAVDGDGSSEKGEDIDSELSKGSAEIPPLDASSENMDLSAKDECSKVVGIADVMPTEAHVECNNLVSEALYHDVDKLESSNLTPNEVFCDITQASILPEITEKAELHVSTTDISSPGGENSVYEVNKTRDQDDNSSKTSRSYIGEDHTLETELMDVEEESTLKLSDQETVKSVGPLKMNQSEYLSPPENEGHFAVSDLVWGKVRSHPWWPGQIFDPADASEKAIKYYKKDSYLVAYFGDRTFAWNDASLLKPFRPHFSQIVKQSNSEAFQNAVDCALEEVSRRVELGLVCSCIPKDAYSKIETQVVENTGIREESSLRYGVDQSSKASHFEPKKLLDYISDLGPRASSGADRLDLAIAQAQLSAFCCFKGYRLPIEFPSSGELLENDVDTEQIISKGKHAPRDDSLSRKERSSTELMGDREYSPDAEDDSISLYSGRKQKAVESLADGSNKRISIHAAEISTAPKPSFKIGECIRRVASQLTGSKESNGEMVIDGSPKTYEHSEKRSVVFSAESFSVDEMLSHLQLVALDPEKRYNLQNIIHTFFLGFRSSIALNRRGRKRETETTVSGPGEEFEFDDANDCYWTDRIVQNYPEEQLLHNSENGGGNLHLEPFNAERSVKPGRKPNSRKRFSTGSYPIELDESVKRRKQECSPAELILNFAERNSVPSEINLNKIFRRFGALMESETEVDHETGRAKVIFKRGSDAEVALNSSEKFNIFGPVLVNYQIGYTPLISVKILPVAVPQSQEDDTMVM